MFAGRGGAEKNLLQLVKGLDRNRYSPSILCLHHGKLLDEIRSDGIEGRELGIERVYGMRGIVEAARLFAYLRRRRIDIVMTYHESSDFWGSIVARLSGVPVVLSNRRDMGYKLKPHHILAYRLLNRLFDRIVVVSEAVRETVALRQKVPWHKLVTVYNGVDTNIRQLEQPDKDRLKESLGLEHRDWLVVGSSGSLRPVKGHRFFIEAAAKVTRRFPNVYFLSVGSSDDTPYLRELQQLARSLGVEKNFVFCGHRNDVLQVVQAMDICVNPSISEGMSNAVLEYLACGKPIVATRVGGNPEVIEDGVTGILVTPGDSASLAAAIVSLLQEPETRGRMGAAGRKAAEQRFACSTMIKSIDRLYTYLLDERGRTKRTLWRGVESLSRGIRTSIKDAAGHAMHYSGISYFTRTLAKNKGIRVLCFHRVISQLFDPLYMCIPTGLFEENIRHIRGRYTPLTLGEAVYLLREHKPIPHDAICLTFDDGYEDNLFNAFPILDHYRVPATLFISAGLVETGGTVWYDKITEAFKKTNLSRIDLSGVGLREYRWSNFRQKNAVCRKLVYFCTRVEAPVRELIAGTIQDGLGGEEPAGLMLDWEGVKNLASRGVTIGSHGYSHCPISELGRDGQVREIQESKRLIRERTGISTVFFTNPFGNPADYSAEIIELLMNNGYTAALSLEKGINCAPSFVLRRFCMTPGMITGVGGTYSSRVFDLQMSRVRDLLRKPQMGTVQTA
jgi:L-malate glycosyltransferase